MKRNSLLFAMLMPTLAFAAGPFDGTWKTDVKSVKFDSKPEVVELNNGNYKCSTCVPKFEIKADGSDQKVTGHAYFDTMSAQVVDPNTVTLTRKLAGKITGSSTWTVAADGKTATVAFKDLTGAQEVDGSQTMIRVTAGAKGAHAISGSWKRDKLPDYSDTGATIVYKMTDDGLQMSWNGQSYDAKFDGRQYPQQNDPGKTMVALKHPSANTIVETDTNDGKVTGVAKSVVSGDGKTMMVEFTDPRNGTTTKYRMDKQ